MDQQFKIKFKISNRKKIIKYKKILKSKMKNKNI
jgi:hypothetical protein